MPRLLIGNFDFEHTLAYGDQQTPSALRRIVAELTCCWLAAAEEGDYLWCPEPIEAVFFETLRDAGLPRVHAVCQVEEVPPGLHLVPWGWTEEVIAWGRSLAAEIDAPQLDAVRTLNSRRFSHDCEIERGVGLEGAAVVETIPELTTAIEQLPSSCGGWVVKAVFSNSSRERFLHQGRQRLDVDALERWAERRIAQGQALFVEPWVERVDEVGVQMTVPRNGQPRVEGVTRLLVDDAGHFRGCDFTPSHDVDPDWSDAMMTALEVAVLAQQTGYFGPLGIDAMRYRTPAGQFRLRPLQDINARWTMGQLSLGLRRLLNENESGRWLFGSSQPKYESDVTQMTTLIPDVIGGWDALLKSVVVISRPSA